MGVLFFWDTKLLMDTKHVMNVDVSVTMNKLPSTFAVLPLESTAVAFGHELVGLVLIEERCTLH